jgi:hypothetical protein
MASSPGRVDIALRAMERDVVITGEDYDVAKGARRRSRWELRPE